MGKNMKNYLLDTNILIYHLTGDIPQKELDKIENILNKSFNISIITKIEFLGWDKHSSDGFKLAEEFLDFANVITITDEIADLSIKIRKNSKIKLPDAVIAATCLNNNLILITRNDKDFKDIPDLEIYNPFKNRYP